MSAGGAGPGLLRIVSWNVRDLLGDPLAVHRVLRTLDPDVACLQELPRRRPTAAPRGDQLARALGLRRLAGGHGTGGTAVLVRPGVTVADVQRLALPVASRRHRTRGAVIAELYPTGGPAVSLACVHLGLRRPERLAHVVAIQEALRARPGRPPLVIAGDLNAAPPSPEWTAWSPVRDPWPSAGATFPAGAPSSRIDVVLLGPQLEAVEYGEPGVDDADVRRASDHRPVLAVVRRRTPDGR